MVVKLTPKIKGELIFEDFKPYNNIDKKVLTKIEKLKLDKKFVNIIQDTKIKMLIEFY